jgi:hypothetical protein
MIEYPMYPHVAHNTKKKLKCVNANCLLKHFIYIVAIIVTSMEIIEAIPFFKSETPRNIPEVCFFKKNEKRGQISHESQILVSSKQNS